MNNQKECFSPSLLSVSSILWETDGSSSYSFSCPSYSSSCSSCFSCCFLGQSRWDGRVLLTGWLPDYGSGFPPSSSIPVSWATWRVDVDELDWWTWWVLGILFIVTPSSIGNLVSDWLLCSQVHLWRALHSAPRSGKTWSEVVEVQDFCLLSADVTGTALNSCSPQTDCVVRNEVTQSPGLER